MNYKELKWIKSNDKNKSKQIKMDSSELKVKMNWTD